MSLTEELREVPLFEAPDPVATRVAPVEPAAVTTPGDLVLADHAVLTVGVAAGGTLRIGRGAQLHASGSAVTIEVGEGARVRGHLECHAQLLWSRSAAAGSVRCAGPLVLDGERLAASIVATTGIASRPAKEVPS